MRFIQLQVPILTPAIRKFVPLFISRLVSCRKFYQIYLINNLINTMMRTKKSRQLPQVSSLLAYFKLLVHLCFIN